MRAASASTEDDDYRRAVQASLEEQQGGTRRDTPSPSSAAAAASSASFAASPSPAPAAASSSPLLSAVQSHLLPFHRAIVRTLLREDGLVILGRGLGAADVWLGFLAHFLTVLPSRPDQSMQQIRFGGSGGGEATDYDPPSVPPPSSAAPYLIFLLNFSDEMVATINEILQTCHQASSAASAPDSSPLRSRGIRSINNEYNTSERSQLYANGGIYSITSRILIVDLLNHLISPDLITGFGVAEAQRVDEASPEAFILRIWRKKNKVGWIKAISEDAMTCSRGAGGGGGVKKGLAGSSVVASSFGGLEIIMKALYLRKVWLYPRFTLLVNETLNPPEDDEEEEEVHMSTHPSSHLTHPRRRPRLDIIELHQPFSELMTAVQNALVEVIDTLITQLKSENKHLTVYDHPSSSNAAGGAAGVAAGSNRHKDAATARTFQSLNLSIEAGLLRNFDSLLRQELNPIQHRLSSRTKSILADLSSLRSCLSFLVQYDCVTFYRYIQLIKSQAVNHVAGHSTWLLSESAERLFKLAKQRLYTVQPGLSKAAAEAVLARQMKKQQQALLKQEKSKMKNESKPAPTKGKPQRSGSSKADAVELSSDDDDVPSPPPSSSAPPPLTPSSAETLCSLMSDSLLLHLEENPKWSLLVDTLDEIETDIIKRSAELEKVKREQELGDIMGGRGVKKEEGNGAASSASSSSSSSTPFQVPPSFGRTLLLVRDARTATFLTRLLSLGGRTLLKNYWKKYLFSLKLHKRNLGPMPASINQPGSAGGWTAMAAVAAASSAKPTPPASTSSSAQVYQQFQRETLLLRKELDLLMEEEQLDRYYTRNQYRQQMQQAQRQRSDEKKREEKEEFHLEEAPPSKPSPSLSPSPAHKPPSSSRTHTPSSSPTKFNPYKAGQRERGHIESLEREVDQREEEELLSQTRGVTMQGKVQVATSAAKPTLQFEAPTTKGGANKAAAAKGKRTAKDLAGISTATRKRPKKTGADSKDSELEDGSAPDSSLDASSADAVNLDGDEPDADMLLGVEDKDEREGQVAAAAAAAAAAKASAFSSSSSSGMPPHIPSVGATSSFLFDRSDVSIIDPNFHMNQVHPVAGQAKTSPFFKTPAATSASSAAASSSSLPPLSSSTTTTVLPSFQLMIHPLKDLHPLLRRYRPEYVLLFDPDITAIRELECFQALESTTWQVHVYFLLYANSLEEQRYISSIEQENKAFDSLITAKKNMVVPVEQDGKIPEPDAREQEAEAASRKNSSLYEDGVRNSTYEAYAATLPSKVDTRRGGHQLDTPGTVLVDVREFRSSLPSQLHAANLTLIPLTLEIADYILTPTLAVERKSIPDLIGSLQGGRLYKQMEQAVRYYKTPVLLIEFDRGRPFMLLSKSDLPAEISSKSIQSKLVLLLLHFPQMRVLWSRDSHATTQLFLALKQRQAQPTVEQAVTANSHTIKSNQQGYEFADVSAGAGLTEEEKEEKNLSLTPHDILRKLPGVNATNIRGLLQNVNNLRELCECSLEQLAKWMGDEIVMA